MARRTGFGRTQARGAALLVVLFALCASLVAPASSAQTSGGRPRRAGTAAKPTPTPTPAARVAAPRPTPTPAPRQTPTPAPVPQQTPAAPTQGGPPRLVTAPTARPDDPAAQDEGGEVDENEVVKIDTSEIKLHVRVVDRYNRPINDVRQDELRVFENGKPQTITSFTREEVPITYGLVVDNSGSLRFQINQVIEAAKTIVESNRPGDETFVIRFVGSEQIELKQDFTADRQAVFDALDDMFVEGGQTAVIDATYLAATHASERRTSNPLEDKRRRAVILVTDGEDRSSHYKTENLFEALKEQDVQIFVIGFVNELEKERGLITKSKRQKAVDLLDRMAKETGGRAFYPTSLSELQGIAEQITKDMRTQFVLSYKPEVQARPGEFRPVRVAVADAPGKEKRIAITRTGYTGRGDQQQQQAPAAQAPAPPSSVRRQ
ncbi:MAG TPA: VWA domain-containing protein [Pyrinomonadaceae bacterium]|jgi:Ca-activated chloride channel family protein|nr:VWA domain-containing protein [Pyrinomonadaceae bacterium]